MVPRVRVMALGGIVANRAWVVRGGSRVVAGERRVGGLAGPPVGARSHINGFGLHSVKEWWVVRPRVPRQGRVSDLLDPTLIPDVPNTRDTLSSHVSIRRVRAPHEGRAVDDYRMVGENLNRQVQLARIVRRPVGVPTHDHLSITLESGQSP